MNEKLRKAIQNNNDLYKAIFKPQNIQLNQNDKICYCLAKTPPLYSNLVTLSADWKPDETFQEIDAKYEKENWDEWSIKDSFQVLDLSEYGFKKLFCAKWLYLESKNFTSYNTDQKLNYEIVKTKEVLADWKKAWDKDENLGKQIFYSELLADSNVYFVAGFQRQNLVSGCFINKTEDVLGISNFFAPDENIKYWSGLIEFVFDSIKQANIVGYERENLAKELEVLDFEIVGDLTIWLKSKTQ